MTEAVPVPNQMHVTKALAMVEQLLASQRNYQACAVLKSASDYILALEERVKDLTPPEDAPAEAAE